MEVALKPADDVNRVGDKFEITCDPSVSRSPTLCRGRQTGIESCR